MKFSLSSLEDMNFSGVAKTNGNILLLVTSGYIILDHQMNKIRLNRNDCHISLEGQLTSVNEYSSDLSGFFCQFDNHFLEQIFLKDNIETELAYINSFMHHYPVRLELPVAKRIENHFHTLQLLNKETPANFPLIHAYLITILYEIKKLMMDHALNPFPSKAFYIAKQYNDLLGKYATTHRSVDFYAHQLNITPNHLNKSVKNATGKNAITLLNETSILQARLLLTQTDKSIGEIAFELGFEDASYFSRFFRKSTGKSPLQYKKLHR